MVKLVRGKKYTSSNAPGVIYSCTVRNGVKGLYNPFLKKWWSPPYFGVIKEYKLEKIVTEVEL